MGLTSWFKLTWAIFFFVFFSMNLPSQQNYVMITFTWFNLKNQIRKELDWDFLNVPHCSRFNSNTKINFTA